MSLIFHVFAKTTKLPVVRLDDSPYTAATIMLSHGILLVIVAGTLGHSISILPNTYAHFIPTMQNLAAELMDESLTPVPIELHPVSS